MSKTERKATIEGEVFDLAQHVCEFLQEMRERHPLEGLPVGQFARLFPRYKDGIIRLVLGGLVQEGYLYGRPGKSNHGTTNVYFFLTPKGAQVARWRTPYGSTRPLAKAPAPMALLMSPQSLPRRS